MERQGEAPRGPKSEQSVFEDPRWEALATGTASPEVIAELRAWAENSKEAKEAFVAFQPPDPNWLGSLADALWQQMEARKPKPRLKTTAGRLFAGKYRLTRVLCSGSWATVWEAEDTSTGRIVAVKRLLPHAENFRENEMHYRLKREARVLGKVEHPGIVRILEHGETAEGVPFLVMQCLQGENLRQLLKSKRRLEPALAVRIARELAGALAALHEARILHRNVSPSNVFLHHHEKMDADDFVLKLIGFGCSKDLVKSDTLVTDKTLAVDHVGYSCPEQLRARKDVDSRTDIWSLGLMLFEMLTGSLPFDIDPAQDLGEQIINNSVPLPSSRVPGIHPLLDQIVKRCTERDREKRIRSAAKVQALLANVEAELLEKAARRESAAAVNEDSALELWPLLACDELPPTPPAPEARTSTRVDTPYRLPAVTEVLDVARKEYPAAGPSKNILRARLRPLVVFAALGALAIGTTAILYRRGISAEQLLLMLTSSLAGYFYLRARREARAKEGLSETYAAVEKEKLSLTGQNRDLAAQLSSLEAVKKRMSGWLDGMEEEINWYMSELEKRPRRERKVYKILTVGMKATGKTSLTLKWTNSLVDLGTLEGTKVERYERTVSHTRNKGTLVEHVFEVRDWSGEHIVDAQQELMLEEIHALLLVVDLGGKDARRIDMRRIREQLDEFQPQALRFFLGPKTVALCKTVVLFINKSDLIPGPLVEAEERAKALYAPLIQSLNAYSTQIEVKVLVGSASYGHGTHGLFSYLVEQILPKSAYDAQLLQRMKAEPRDGLKSSSQ